MRNSIISKFHHKLTYIKEGEYQNYQFNDIEEEIREYGINEFHKMFKLRWWC